MLKIRLQGTKRDICWFCSLLGNQSEVEVIQDSEIFSNKGTNKFYRAYVEIQRRENMEDKGNE